MYNIVREFNIDYGSKRDQNNAVSVKLWVTEMRSHGVHCPVLYYKSDVDSNLDNEDFILILMTNFQTQQIVKFGQKKICIDGAYDILLYTIMTVDEFRSGCPVAFCFSNRSDECLFRIFFMF